MRSTNALPVAVAVAVSMFLTVCKAAEKNKTGHMPAPDFLFTNQQPFRIQIEIPESGMRTLRQAPRNQPGSAVNEDNRPSVKVVVREGAKNFADVALHLKGGAGSFRGIDDRPSLTLNFDKHVKGQTFHGLERVSLNNSVQDPSLLNEVISRELFAAAGIPVPRAAHATVELNGRDLGVYVLTEAFNKQFLLSHFENPNGNLYDGGLLRDVTDLLEKTSGPNPAEQSDLRKLADAAKERNRTHRFERLSGVLDMDRFITYLALDVMLCNWDGYALNRNNYRIYHDPKSDKLVFMPHGLDQMFGGGRMNSGTEMPILPRSRGLVARAVLGTPEGRRRYRERIAQLMNNAYNVQSITNRAWEVFGRLRPVLAEKGSSEVRSREREVGSLCERVAQRAESIQEQLVAPSTALKFEPTGAARFAEWRHRADHGTPTFNEVTEGGKRLLHIGVTKSSVGVWTTQVALEPGDYQLVGRVKCQGVVPDPGDRRGGVGLRVSGQRFTQKFTGETAWTEVTFDFQPEDTPIGFGFGGDIQDDITELELICELRAAKGEAWFDVDSLRLIKK